MAFPGTWANANLSLVYRPIPKCACTTVGQLLYWSGNGSFFDGDIHHAGSGVWKWDGHPDAERARQLISQAVRDPASVVFTCVRNPYARVLSAFFDKICGYQSNGNKYGGKLLSGFLREYNIETEGEFDQILSFRRFLLFVRDTIKFRHPKRPDIHWSRMSAHARTLVQNGGAYDFVFPTEQFHAGMQAVLDRTNLMHAVDLESLPRFNEGGEHGPERAHPVEDFFDEISNDIMLDIYRRDFSIFKYPRHPGDGGPEQQLDAEEINAQLAG